MGGGGVCLVGGVVVVSGLGGSAWSGGVSAWSGGCLPGPGGWSLIRGGIPACTEADPLPPVNRMTDRCKNITLATTSLRPVKILFHSNKTKHYHPIHCEPYTLYSNVTID